MSHLVSFVNEMRQNNVKEYDLVSLGKDLALEEKSELIMTCDSPEGEKFSDI